MVIQGLHRDTDYMGFIYGLYKDYIGIIESQTGNSLNLRTLNFEQKKFHCRKTGTCDKRSQTKQLIPTRYHVEEIPPVSISLSIFFLI